MAITAKTLRKYFETKLAAEAGPWDLKRIIENESAKWTILDVRRPEDYQKEHIAGAINIPLAEIDKRWKEISKKTKVVAYCYNITCAAAPKAAEFLNKKGIFARELVGGIAEWKNSGFPVEAGSASYEPHRERAAA